ncbi:MAG: hypothetical protein DRG35_03385 [Deltaproteobacteria bacterium]|nr:MAG: hypothetical protein DRG35_03385 [Deltaproteobacteria bacterium]
MESFGEALRKARIANKVTLREIAEHIGKSIGYLSDVEHNRKSPPKLEVVSEIEDFLGIEDGKLLRLAKQFRKAPKAMTQQIRMKPRLSAILLRADRDLSEDEFDELLSYLERIEKRRKSSCHKGFLLQNPEVGQK